MNFIFSNKYLPDYNSYYIYGFFQLISNPIYYFVWIFLDHQSYENLYLRILISLFCIPLVINRHLPKVALKYLKFYWYFVCIYTLPFFFTFMLLKNNFSYGWSLNSLTGIVLSILLIEIETLVFLIPLGSFFGWLAYYLTTNSQFYNFSSIKTIVITFSSTLLFGGLFAQNTRKIQDNKLHAMKALAGAIAHEMRTPFLGIRGCGQTLKNALPLIVEKYRRSKDLYASDQDISESKLQALISAPEQLEKITQSAYMVIDMLLMNLKEDWGNNKNTERCSMQDSLQEAFKDYPLTSKEHNLIDWSKEPDFVFSGHKLLMKHVIFNLLKNALYYAKASQNGKIFITVQTSASENILYFKDTGTGIPPHILPYTFDKFYSKTRQGTGIGLAFCQSVIESFGGSITCKSTENECTTFTIKLPIINSNNN